MHTAYEYRLLVRYLANAAARMDHRDRAPREMVDWLLDRDDRPAFDDRRLLSCLDQAQVDADAGDRILTFQLRRLQRALRDEHAAVARTRPDRTARRLRRLGETTALSRVDVDILELLLRCQTQPVIESMIEGIFGGHNTITFGRRGSYFKRGASALSVALGVSDNAVRGRLAAGAPLIRSGLVAADEDGDLEILGRLRRLATAPGRAEADVNGLLLDAAPASDLEWSDFDHIAGPRDHIERLVMGALEKGEEGVNILLYGPPGTGKTEFCKVLAERVGIALYSAGETDDDGDEPSRRERLQEFRLAQRLLARDRKSLLMFDEMEDLLPGWGGGFSFFGPMPFGGGQTGDSKVFMHRLLEEAPTPTLWTANDTGSMSKTILRRMMYALEMRPPTATVRARIWERQLERHSVATEPGDAAALAREFAATPGVAAGATAAARIVGGDIDTVRRGMRSLSRALSCDTPPEGTPPLFDPALVRADTDPVALAERLVRSGERRFSLCLQGPPGTGKSAYVRYLAERLGLEVMHKRASDLMSMWVGGTEKEIADAFAEARDTGAFLVFDEADSLLADRRSAVRSWEVSQVNEMLTWMESHPEPFACTTNFGNHLDSATLRRFVFKIVLDYLSPEQVEGAFRTYFDLARRREWQISPPSPPATSPRCVARRRSWGGWRNRRRWPTCSAPSATPSPAGPGLWGFWRRGERQPGSRRPAPPLGSSARGHTGRQEKRHAFRRSGAPRAARDPPADFASRGDDRRHSRGVRSQPKDGGADARCRRSSVRTAGAR